MWYRRFTIILFGLATLLFLTPVRPVQAAPIQDDQVILGDDATLVEGEHVDGDLVVVGGDLTMRVGSRVAGNAAVIGGEARVDGTVGGDLVAFGGNITLGNGARVEGDVVALGGRVHRAEGAQVGSVVEGPNIGTSRFWRSVRVPIFGGVGFRPGSAVWFTISALVGAAVLAFIGMAVITFWPTQTAEVGRTIVAAPVPSLGIGCLTYPLSVVIALFILITICLAPFVPVLVLLVVAAGLFGWIALGTLLGRWLARATGWRTATPAAVAGLGVFALSILAVVLGEIPCLGTLAVIGAASIGLGAVALSRFGTRRYGVPPAEVAVPAVPSAPTAPQVEVEPQADVEPLEGAEPPAEVEPQTGAEPPPEAEPPA